MRVLLLCFCAFAVLFLLSGCKYTDVLTEETISNVPIHCLNLPKGKVLRTFPRYAKVHFVAGVSQIRALRADDFKVVTQGDVNNTALGKIFYIGYVVIERYAVLDTKQVDYLIEDE